MFDMNREERFMKNIWFGKVWKNGFILVELLIVIIIIVVFVVIVIFKFLNLSFWSKELVFKGNFKIICDVVDLFKVDMGVFLVGLIDLVVIFVFIVGLDFIGILKNIVFVDFCGFYV